jgi:hypothetical protein
MLTTRSFLGYSALSAALLFALGAGAQAHANILLSWSDFFTSIWNGVANFFSLQSGPTLSAQAQFAQRLSLLQNNTQNLVSFYLSNAQTYNLSVNKSWSVQITDKNSTSSPAIGELTITWLAGRKSLMIQNGIVNTKVSPTYAVTITNKAFVVLSQDVATRNLILGLLDYNMYKSAISYKQVK